MTEQEVLKKKRTSAKAKFTRTISSLQQLLDNQDNSIEEVTRAFEDFDKAWIRLQERHDNYVETLDEDSHGDDVWIETEQSRHDSLRKEYYSYLAHFENMRKSETCAKMRSVQENAFNEHISLIEALLRRDPTTETVLRERKSLQTTYERLCAAHTDVLFSIPVEQQSSEGSWLTAVYEHFSKCVNEIEKYVETKSNSSSSNRKYRMEKLNLPKFDGDVRNFPRFMKDLQLVLPCLIRDEYAFTLRQCLSAEVLQYLGNGDDFDEMIKILKTRYGDPSKVVDSVISDIQCIKKLDDGDCVKLIKLVNVIDTGYRDLKSLDLEREISNAHVVNLIENKLPRQLQLEWYRNIHRAGSSVDRKNKFPSLLEFLKVERAALEYGTSELKGNQRQGNIHAIEASGCERTCLVHGIGGHDTKDCRQYKSLSVAERYAIVKSTGACYGCLCLGHQVRECAERTICGNGCEKYHHSSLHEKNKSSAHTVGNFTSTDNSVCLLPIMKVKVSSPYIDSLGTLWDSGASITLILNSKAKSLRLKGKPVQLSITKVGGTEEVVSSHLYDVPLLRSDGRRVHIRAYGIDKITSNISRIDLSNVIPLFKDVKINDIVRPEGEIDLLIGYEYAGLHPIRKRAVDNLLLLGNEFGECVAGSHPGIVENTRRSIVSNLTTVINYVQAGHSAQDFFSIESMGVECNPKCGNCLCRKCPIGGKSYTLKEERELNIIKENLVYNGGYWVATYPWKRSPKLLPDNYDYVLKALRRTEKQLCCDETWKKTYVDQIQDMLDRKAARKLTSQEIRSYKGPKKLYRPSRGSETGIENHASENSFQ